MSTDKLTIVRLNVKMTSSSTCTNEYMYICRRYPNSVGAQFQHSQLCQVFYVLNLGDFVLDQEEFDELCQRLQTFYLCDAVE